MNDLEQLHWIIEVFRKLKTATTGLSQPTLIFLVGNPDTQFMRGLICALVFGGFIYRDLYDEAIGVVYLSLGKPGEEWLRDYDSIPF